MGLNEETVRKIMKEEMQEVSLSQSVMKEELQEVTKEVHALSLRQHVMNEKLPKIIDIRITPSEYKKSTHKEAFLDVMGTVGFGRLNMSQRVEVFKDTIEKSTEFDYCHKWVKGQPESSSYNSLVGHLTKCGIFVVCVDSGQGLPDGLLYYEEIWTLKKNISLRSEELRKIGEQSVFKYTICGRTDLVIVRYKDDALGKSNNRYFVEIKRPEDFNEEGSLREAALQLIGGNIANSFHSPPVVLTDLAKEHFVLFVKLDGDPMVELKFQLKILKMPNFGTAIAYVEKETTTFKSVTLHFGRKPTPPTSPLNDTTSVEASEDVEAFTEFFSSVAVHDATTNDKLEGDAF